MTLSDWLPWPWPTVLPAAGWLLLAVVTVYEAVFSVRHMACHPDRCTCPLPHRWLAGIPLHGRAVWDATFWRKGQNDLTHSKTAPSFPKLPGWQRRLIRTGPVLATGGLLAAPLPAAGVMTSVAALAVTARALRRTGRAARLRGWLLRRLHWLRHRGRVQNTSMALASIAGTATSAVQKGVTWNRGYASARPGEEVLRWVLPRGFKATDGERTLAQKVWQDRVGYELTFAWRMDEHEPVMVATRARDLPRLVLLEELRDRILALPEDKTAIGPDDQGNLVCYDWALESPHALINAASRHGKTELEMSLVAQVLRKGGEATYIDVKRTSIQGMKGLPRLTLLDNPRDMARMWLEISKWGKELDRRIDERTKDPTLEFTRNLLVIEEVNQFSEMCDEFWENWPEEDDDWRGTILWKPKRAKRTPPIWRVVKHGVWEGAFAKMHVLIAGQNIEAQTVKGIRNSIGMRMLGGYQPQNWKALVGTSPIPPAPPQKGRWCMVNGSSQTWVQSVIADLDANVSAAIWRDFARDGRRLDGSRPPVTGPVTVTGHSASPEPFAQVSASGTATLTDLSRPGTADPRGVLVSLSEAVRDGHVPGATVRALQMDRHRSGRGELPGSLKFPAPAGMRGAQTELFWSSELTAFNEARRGERIEAP